MNTTTKSTKASAVSRSWHLVDANGKVLGRVAVDVASKLIGKNKPYFVRNMDCGDHVVVINAKNFVVTGHKEKEKMYTRYSGFPGGLKTKPLWVMRKEKPQEIIRRAVMGMLPKNKLRNKMITRLYVYPDAEHPYLSKFI